MPFLFFSLFTYVVIHTQFQLPIWNIQRHVRIGRPLTLCCSTWTRSSLIVVSPFLYFFLCGGGWCCIVGCAVLIREPGHQSMPSAEPTSQLHIILLTNRYIGSYECIPTVENRAVERASQHHHHHLFSFLWSFLFLTTAGKDGSRFIIKKARVVNF